MSKDRAKKLYKWARTLPKERAAALSLGISAAVLVIWTMTQGVKYPRLIPVYELGLVAGLVGMTAMYVYFTSKMAEEMRKQRYSESLPLLAPTIPPILSTDELPYESMQSGIGVKVIWRNVGKGAAINARFRFYPVPISSEKA